MYEMHKIVENKFGVGSSYGIIMVLGGSGVTAMMKLIIIGIYLNMLTICGLFYIYNHM